jgi:hypothetical protein
MADQSRRVSSAAGRPFRPRTRRMHGAFWPAYVVFFTNSFAFASETSQPAGARTYGMPRWNSRFTDEQWQLVEQLVRADFSPEQISGRLRCDQVLSISHETIYQRIWQDKRRGGSLFRRLLSAPGTASATAPTRSAAACLENATFLKVPEAAFHRTAASIAGSPSKPSETTRPHPNVTLATLLGREGEADAETGGMDGYRPSAPRGTLDQVDRPTTGRSRNTIPENHQEESAGAEAVGTARLEAGRLQGVREGAVRELRASAVRILEEIHAIGYGGSVIVLRHCAPAVVNLQPLNSIYCGPGNAERECERMWTALLSMVPRVQRVTPDK